MRLRISPLRTWKLKPSTAVRPPKRQVRSCVSSRIVEGDASAAGATGSAMLDLPGAYRVQLRLLFGELLGCLGMQLACPAALRQQALRTKKHDTDQDQPKQHGL